MGTQNENEIAEDIKKGWAIYDSIHIEKQKMNAVKEEVIQKRNDECECGGKIIRSNGDYFCEQCGTVVDVVVDQGIERNDIILNIGTIEKKRKGTIIQVRKDPVRYMLNGKVILWCERMSFDMTTRQWNILRAKKTKTIDKMKLLIDRTRRNEGHITKEEMAFLCGVSTRTVERYIRDDICQLDRLILSSSNTPSYEGKRAYYRGGSGKVDYRRTDGGGTLIAMREWWYGYHPTPKPETNPQIFKNAFECAFFPPIPT